MMTAVRSIETFRNNIKALSFSRIKVKNRYEVIENRKKFVYTNYVYKRFHGAGVLFVLLLVSGTVCAPPISWRAVPLYVVSFLHQETDSSYIQNDSLTLMALLHEAQKPEHINKRWSHGVPIKNAHYTNTKVELLEALQDDYNFLEGDIRMYEFLGEEGQPEQMSVMWHDPLSNRGLSLSEWLRIGNESGRGLKLDVKEARAVDAVIETVKIAMQKFGLHEDRLIFNADVIDGPGAYGTRLAATFAGSPVNDWLKIEHLMKFHQAFPLSTISIGSITGRRPLGERYSKRQIQTMIAAAKSMGGNISFPLRAEFVDRKVVEQLIPYGQVAVWNSPSTYTPVSIIEGEQFFRKLGVNGAIDLRFANHPLKAATPTSSDSQTIQTASSSMMQTAQNVGLPVNLTTAIP